MGAAAGAAQVGLGGLQMLEAKNQADAIKRQSEFEAKQQEFNANLIGIQQEELERQSKKDINRRNSETKQMIGSQKVSLAAQGIDVDSDVARVLEKEERRIGREDAQVIKNNAWRESMGLEIAKHDLRTQAGFTRLGGKEQARSTLVSGGLGAASSMLSGASKFK